MNYVAFSKSVWDKLSSAQQATVQKAAVDAAESARQIQLQKEEDLVSFLNEKGLEIYEPNLAAFRDHVQKMYLETDASDPWPDGVLDKINSLGN